RSPVQAPAACLQAAAWAAWISDPATQVVIQGMQNLGSDAGVFVWGVDFSCDPAITSRVIPGRRTAPSPESIAPPAHGLLRLSPRKRQARNALSWRDERHRSPRVRTQEQSGGWLHEAICRRQTGWFEIYDDPTTAIAREKE